MQELLDQVIAALEHGERLALITAVRSVGSTPRHHAARQAVFANGETAGTIGGGTMELQAVADARHALVENRSRLVEYNLNGQGEGSLGLCGGTQEIFIDILEPASGAAAQLRAVCAALARGEPVVLAETVRSDHPNLVTGTRRVIPYTGAAVGSLGDVPLDGAVTEHARRAMLEHYPQRLGFDPATGAVKRLMATRRAAVEIFLDLYEPRPRLLIIGAGHIGAALAKQGRWLDWQVEVMDDRPAFLTRHNLPDADATHLVDYNPAAEVLGPPAVHVTPGTAVVVATWGWDQPALRWLAGAPLLYVGLVASPRKAAVIFERLREQGIDSTWLNEVRVPVGLDVGAESPAEIALAIMAEILTVARGKSGRPLCEIRSERVAALFAPARTVPAEMSQ